MSEALESEILLALRSAVASGLHSFRIDSRRQDFLIACAAYGEKRGWITVEEITVDEQSAYWRCTFTEKGKSAFGVEVSHV